MASSPPNDEREIPQEEDPGTTRWAELDARSLAVFRVVLGLFVILTVASSWADAAAFFTDQGVLPRDTLVRSHLADDWLCFHLGAGALWCPLFFNALLAAFAVGLILGWRTTWMGLGCWVLLNSLQVRNPFICDRGDLQLELMLFWGLFLPLGSRWSLDARSRRVPFGACRGLAPAALVVQIAVIYLMAAYEKNGPFWLGRGDALWHSLVSPLFATSLSQGLAQVPAGWLTALNYAVIAAELFVGLLLLCPVSVSLTRGIAVILLVGFHLGVAALFQLGLFPWIGACMPLALLPRELWDGWGQRVSSALDRRLGGDPNLAERLPARLGLLRSAFVGLALTLALLSNLSAMSFAQGLQRSALMVPIKALRLSQHWDLFSPIPPYYGWFVLQGKDGHKLFEGPPTRENPDLEPFPSHRWRMLMIASLYPELSVLHPGLVKALAARKGDIAAEDYRFRVRLPDDQGRLPDPITWKLWRAPQTPDPPPVTPNGQNSPMVTPGALP